MIKLNYHTLESDLEFTFTISRSSKSISKTIITKISYEHNGETFSGIGEAVFSKFYGEDEESVKAFYQKIINDKSLEGLDIFNIQDLELRLEKYPGNYAAKAGIDIALYDIRAKILKLPLYKYFGLDKTKAPASSYTIGIADLDTIKQKTLTALERGYDILKVKLGCKDDLEIIKTIRKLAPNTRIRVDANCAWTLKESLEVLAEIKALNIEFVEEPLLQSSSLEEYKELFLKSPLPLMADESCKRLLDIPHCAKYFHMINLKLTKTGGLTEAIRMIHAARAHGLKIMLGCFTETNVSISAMASISPLVDFTDLDGALLLAKDPYANGLFQRNEIHLHDRVGLGIEISTLKP